MIMDENLSKAIEILNNNNNFTCVFSNGTTIIKSEKRGVAPLLELVASGNDFTAFSCADKVIGKGAALLYCLLKPKIVYSNVISECAKETFLEHNIKFLFKNEVKYILNRAKSGKCPIENAVADINEPNMAVKVIIKTLAELRENNERR